VRAMAPGRWGRLTRRLGVAALGAGPSLAFPHPSLWWLAAIGLMPVLVVVRAAPTPREAALRGWWAGGGFAFAAHHWLVPNVGPFVVPLAALVGAPVAAWAWAAWHLLGATRSARDVATSSAVLASGWVLYEVARSWEPLGGPWNLLGASAWQTGWLLSLAALGGVWLISFVLVAINVAVVHVVLAGIPRPVRTAGAGLAVVLVGLTGLWSAARPDPEGDRLVRVLGVQPGVIHDVEERFTASEVATLAAADAEPDLVVWGESSVGLDLETSPEHLRRVQHASRAVGAEVLVNVDARRGPGGIFKSTLLVDSDGIRDRYDKMRLVPFGERIPLRPVFSWVELLPRAPQEDRQRGDGLVLLRTEPAVVGPLVCFESAFPDMARRLAADGAELIVVQSATSTFQQSWTPAQHASLAALRAVETGRPVLHATLTGTSAAFDATGHRLMWFDTSQQGSYVIDVPLASWRTPYVRAGDWVPLMSAAVVAAAAAVSVLRRAQAER
jgi:apolipoprotein N-acyltransferase